MQGADTELLSIPRAPGKGQGAWTCPPAPAAGKVKAPNVLLLTFDSQRDQASPTPALAGLGTRRGVKARAEAAGGLPRDGRAAPASGCPSSMCQGPPWSLRVTRRPQKSPIQAPRTARTHSPGSALPATTAAALPGPQTHLDQVINVDLAILVVVQGRGQADKLVFWNVLDLLHGVDELGDADDGVPGEGDRESLHVTACTRLKAPRPARPVNVGRSLWTSEGRWAHTAQQVNQERTLPSSGGEGSPTRGQDSTEPGPGGARSATTWGQSCWDTTWVTTECLERGGRGGEGGQWHTGTEDGALTAASWRKEADGRRGSGRKHWVKAGQLGTRLCTHWSAARALRPRRPAALTPWAGPGRWGPACQPAGPPPVA